MPKLEVHCADCQRELGEPFEKVHIWLDELFQTLGSAHRDVRHNVNGVSKVKEMWGEKASRAAEIHIQADEHGSVPKCDIVFMTRLAFNPKIYAAFHEEYKKE